WTIIGRRASEVEKRRGLLLRKLLILSQQSSGEKIRELGLRRIHLEVLGDFHFLFGIVLSLDEYPSVGTLGRKTKRLLHGSPLLILHGRVGLVPGCEHQIGVVQNMPRDAFGSIQISR